MRGWLNLQLYTVKNQGYQFDFSGILPICLLSILVVTLWKHPHLLLLAFMYRTYMYMKSLSDI